MKNLDLKEMSNVNGGGFWSGFCSGMMGASAAVTLGLAVGAAIPGGAVIIGVGMAGCFLASIDTN